MGVGDGQTRDGPPGRRSAGVVGGRCLCVCRIAVDYQRIFFFVDALELWEMGTRVARPPTPVKGESLPAGQCFIISLNLVPGWGLALLRSSFRLSLCFSC